ncbi:MAG: hypothetical protein JXA11_02795 [Phycisphaerae bacterium]|nr:hypothetical protein [Phycisphaerae bacterium]
MAEMYRASGGQNPSEARFVGWFPGYETGPAVVLDAPGPGRWLTGEWLPEMATVSLG